MRNPPGYQLAALLLPEENEVRRRSAHGIGRVVLLAAQRHDPSVRVALLHGLWNGIDTVLLELLLQAARHHVVVPAGVRLLAGLRIAPAETNHTLMCRCGAGREGGVAGRSVGLELSDPGVRIGRP